MDRYIARWAYWIGLAFIVISVGWRGLDILWPAIPNSAFGIFRMSLRNAGIVFLWVSIASVAYGWLRHDAAQDTRAKGAGAD